MSNFSTFAMITEGNISTAPNQFVASTPDSLGTITATGYLNDLSAKIKANDIIWVNYSDTSVFPLSTGENSILGQFIVNYNAPNWSLSAAPGFVTQTESVAISAADFNGMYAAPKLLVAAPGANKLLVLDSVSLVMTYGTANYAAGGVAAVQYDSTINGAGVIASTTLAAATFQAAASTTFTFNRGVVPAPFTTTVNKGLYLSNITGAFTTGDSPMVAHVNYHTIATA